MAMAGEKRGRQVVRRLYAAADEIGRRPVVASNSCGNVSHSEGRSRQDKLNPGHQLGPSPTQDEWASSLLMGKREVQRVSSVPNATSCPRQKT